LSEQRGVSARQNYSAPLLPVISARRCLCILSLLSSVLLPCWVVAQDVRLAQPYANGLILNPAMAGLTAVRSLTVATRNQAPETGQNFLTGALCGDARISRLRGALGGVITYDRAGDAPINRMQVAAIYAYHTRLSTRWSASGAISTGIGFQHGNLNRYVFGDQLLPDGSTTGTSETTNFLPVTYPTIGAGIVVFEEQAWLGLAVHHANAPRLGNWPNAAKLAPRMVLHGGYKFYLRSALSLNRFYEFSLTPLATVQLQGPARGIDAGFSLTYSPVVFGALYRNPLLLSGARDQRWVVLQLGLRRPGFGLGYSYELGIGSQTAGFSAHEITLRFDQPDFSGLLKKRNAPKQVPFVGTPAF
jgi:type IX secretion system PorP/SprF family membrane protein